MRTVRCGWRSHAIAWLSLLVVVTPAAAQPPTDTAPAEGAANDHAAQGRRLYDLRRYDQAIAEFEKAYQVDNDPAHLYNIAQAHRLANQIPQAAAAYRSYLQRLPGAPNRADVERRIAELESAQRPPNNLEPPPGGAAGQTAAGPPSAYPAGYGPGPPPLLGDPRLPPAGYGAVPPAGYGAAPAVAASGTAPGHHTHDGFFLRLQLGIGFMNMSATNTDLRVHGSAGTVALAIGGAIGQRWVLFGELGGGSTSEPTVSDGNESASFNGSLTVANIAVGAAYYFMPNNVYVSASLGASQVNLEIEDQEYESDTGAGLTLSLGKEWWVSPDFGIGAALQLHGSAIPANESSDAETLQTGWAAVVFSATYN